MESQGAKLAGKKVAILIANGFEETEMANLHKELVGEGAQTLVVSPEKGVVNGWHDGNWGHFFPVNEYLPDALSYAFDAVVIPGGSRHIARLQSNPQSARFLKGFLDERRPVGIFNDAGAVLAGAELIAGRTVSASEEAKEVLEQKGAVLSEEPIFVDNRLVSGRDELEPFIARFVDTIVEFANEVEEAA